MADEFGEFNIVVSYLAKGRIFVLKPWIEAQGIKQLGNGFQTLLEILKLPFDTRLDVDNVLLAVHKLIDDGLYLLLYFG